MQKIGAMDSFDRKILDRVRRNNQEPARILAEKVGLSVSAVLRRLRRMREEKIIIADVAIVDPALTGSAITLHVLLKVKQANPQVVDDFARKIAAHSEVVAGWDVTGDDDFLLKVQVNSMKEYDEFTRRVLAAEAGIVSFKTLINIRTIKEDEGIRRPLIG
ncbi:MAG: Lrp/AsnC family transcriptional regulator [Sphingobium sp.]|nr:Lrp/AsnC family transcriptional regulator [Sphingobium sp.]